jgi:GAF domain-containing protein
MRYKDTIKGAKKILKVAKKNPSHYTESELLYVKMLKKQAKKALERKQLETEQRISETSE